MSDRRRFRFAFAPSYRVAALAFGIRPANAWVEISDATFEARFGRWRVVTDVDNIKRVAVTGPYSFVKTAGPARLAITDRGLTFATNGDRGVLVVFRAPVPGLDPFGAIQHPELTVTVAEVEQFAEALNELCGSESGR